MVDLAKRKIAVAGKLAGRYASRLRELRGRLEQIDAELLDGFDAGADVIVLGAKSKGFMKRIQRGGATTVTEAQLEAAVEHVFDKPSAPNKKKKYTGRDFADALGTVARSAPRSELRTAITAAIEHAHASGYDVFPSATPLRWPPLEAEAPTYALLAWCTRSDARLYRVPELPKDSALQRDLATLANATIYTGDDCPLPTFGAAMRTMVAIGDDAARVWASLAGELDNRDGHQAAGLTSQAELEATPPTLAEHMLREPAELTFGIDRLFVVHDDIPW
ncbi:MAG: hypothetical protein AAF721_05725 [Myxococcota bacterium]